MKPAFHRFFLAALLGTATLSPALAAETFTFVRPGNPIRAFQQTEPLRVALPAGLQGDELNQLFLELNGIDITQTVRVENGVVVFYPSSPYDAGSQTLRLVRLGKNGKLVELSRWNFIVASAPPVSSPSSVSGSVDATYSLMPYENGDQGETPDRNNLASQFRVEGSSQQGAWQLKGRANGFVNTDAEFNPAGEGVEVGEYLLSAERPGDSIDTLLRLGHHDIGANNILMNGFYRRGASAQFAFEDTATVTGFAQNPAALFGNDDFTGVENANQRVEGLHATFKPVPEKSDATLEATAYDGSGSLVTTPMNTAVGAVETPSRDGRGYQLGLSSTLVQDYAALRAQAAHADFDPDGSGVVSPMQDDHAGRVSVVFTPLGKQLSDEGRVRLWNVELAYQQVGTLFQSLLNPMLETDRKTYSLGSNYLHDSTTIDGQLNWVTDNVNDLAVLPDNRSLNGWVQASHALDATIKGRPVLFAGAAAADENRLSTPFGYVGPGLNRFNGSLNAGVALSFEKTSVNLTQTYSTLDDDVTAASSYHSHYTDLTLELRPDERITLRPGLQMEHLNQKFTGASKSYHASMGGDFIIKPGKFWNNTNLSFLLNEGASTARNNTMAQTEFTWLLKPAEINSPGYALGLAGQYGNMTDPETRLIEDEKETRIFLRLKFSAPFAF